MEIEDLQNETLKVAADHIRDQNNRMSIQKLWIVCLCILLCAAIVCGTVISCTAISKQQTVLLEQLYSLNMQYASLADVLYGMGVEIESREVINGSDGGNAIKIEGDNNQIGGE